LHVAEDDDPEVATRLEQELVRVHGAAPATTARLCDVLVARPPGFTFEVP
jgi:hypothetical protein